jgi:gamma-glutamyltranspeptidase
VENRLSSGVIEGLKRMGIMPRPLGTYHWSMGSMQAIWKRDNLYYGTADPRRLGEALGY